MASKKKSESFVEVAAKLSRDVPQTSLDERRKASLAAIQQIEKQFGKGSIMKMDGPIKECPHISTGILSLDIATGIGGLPRGRIVEIYGPESSGKTTLCLSTVANAQRNGGLAAYVDAEHALDPAFAKKLGVNMDDLLVAQPDNGEEALEITEALVRSNSMDIIIVDSVAALVPRAELEGNMGDAQMGLHARLMSQAMRKLTGAISKSNTTVVFINQIRNKIGVMFGSPETTTGGNALKFYASMRLDIRRKEILKEKIDSEEVAYGNRVKIKIIKNKLAPPFREAEIDHIYELGYDAQGCVLEIGEKLGIIERSGTWYSYKGDRIGQGRKNAAQNLRENNEWYEKIKADVMAAALTAAPQTTSLPDENDGEAPEEE